MTELNIEELGALGIVGLALLIIYKLIDFYLLRRNGASLRVDFSPVVSSIDHLGQSIEEGQRAVLEVLKEISDRQRETMEQTKATRDLLTKEDPITAIPRVYCQSPASLEKVTSGPLKDLRRSLDELAGEFRKERRKETS